MDVQINSRTQDPYLTIKGVHWSISVGSVKKPPKQTKIDLEIFLTETELRRLHRRFGHPTTDRLHSLLIKAGHKDVSKSFLKEIEKFCHNCQMNHQSPRRFKFTLHEDYEFNYEIMVDIMYLNNRPVLHVIDVATAFQAGKFMTSLTALGLITACFLWENHPRKAV